GGSQLVPWKDEDTEIWACNDLPQRYNGFRFDRCFQFHSDHDRMRVAWPEWENHLAWLRQPHDLLIYMQEEYDNVPSGIRFPKEKIEAMVPHGWYFAHTFCWMVAFAILLEYEEIHLYGVGSFSGEPMSADRCIHYWIGVAEGRGIKVEIHGEGELFVIEQVVRSKKQYGYDLTRLVLEHQGPDPMSGTFPPNGPPDYPELDTLQLYDRANTPTKAGHVSIGIDVEDPALRKHVDAAFKESAAHQDVEFALARFRAKAKERSQKIASLQQKYDEMERGPHPTKSE
ncbi:hypothetical protein LCGC14_2527480, partial [marine sediment metagenome]